VCCCPSLLTHTLAEPEKVLSRLVIEDVGKNVPAANGGPDDKVRLPAARNRISRPFTRQPTETKLAGVGDSIRMTKSRSERTWCRTRDHSMYHHFVPTRIAVNRL
jgi:hypothetical protein